MEQRAIGKAYTAMLEEARKRRARALRMKESGMTIQEVGNSLGVTKQRAAELISRARHEAGK